MRHPNQQKPIVINTLEWGISKHDQAAYARYCAWCEMLGITPGTLRNYLIETASIQNGSGWAYSN